MWIAVCYQFSVQLSDRVAASLPLFDQMGQMWINTGFSGARLLFWKGAIREPARNGGTSNPYLLGDGGLREPLPRAITC
jgi:hypothetical protein